MTTKRKGSWEDSSEAKEVKNASGVVTCNRCKKSVKLLPENTRTKRGGRPIMESHTNARDDQKMTCSGAFTTDWTAKKLPGRPRKVHKHPFQANSQGACLTCGYTDEQDVNGVLWVHLTQVKGVPGVVCPHGVHVTKECNQCPEGWARGEDPDALRDDEELKVERLARINKAQELLQKAVRDFNINNFWGRDPVEVFQEIRKTALEAANELEKYCTSFEKVPDRRKGAWPRYQVGFEVLSPLPQDQLAHEVLDAIKTSPNSDGFQFDGEISLEKVGG